MKNDGSEVIYPITLTNDGENTKSYSVVLDGANWADLSLREPNAFVLKPKESKALNVFASTKTKESGEKTFFVTVRNNDKSLKQIPLKANILTVKRWYTFIVAPNLKNLLEIFLILVIIALVTVGVFYGINEMDGKAGKESAGQDAAEANQIPDSIQGEAYY